MTDKINYPKPSYAADIVLLTGQASRMRVLVITRKNDPFKGQYALPGGYVNEGETAHEAAVRELMEETNINASELCMIPLSTRTRKGRDPRGWVISSPFLIYTPRPIRCKAGDDALKAQWIDLEEIDTFAFDHGAIVCEALSKFWQQFPNADSRLNYIPYGMSYILYHSANRTNSNKHTLMFGGSFNPWHEGHSHALKRSFELEFDHHLIIPDQNPHKPLKSVCAWQHYKLIFNSALNTARKFTNPEHRVQTSHTINVYPGFLGIEYPNYLCNWYNHVKYPGSVSFLMGDDTFLSLTSWKNYDKIVDSTEEFVVVSRNHSEQEISDYAVFNNLSIHYIDDNPHNEVSSTQLRDE